MNNDNDEDGYSKLKHIIKENVKAILFKNKQVISVSFAALIQTLKANPQMVNLIYNLFSMNNNEQKDNNNNTTKYPEFNKDRILDLAEKNYKNLVEILTNNNNNAIDTADYSSNPTSSLPQSHLHSQIHRIKVLLTE